MTARKPAIVAAIASIVLTFSTFTHAQAPAAAAQTPVPPPAAAAPQARAEQRLPVRRVVLYKSGVGYFEHVGKVRGNQNVTIDFTSGQLNDVLKSLTTIDLDGGRVTGVNYNSEAGLERRLSSLRLPVGQNTTRAQFLSALRGARLDVRSGTTHVVGRLLSVESVERHRDNTTTTVETISVVTDAGEMQTIALDPGVVVRIAESDLNQEVGRYLSLVASVRDQDLRRLTIATAGSGERDLFVSYVSEVPVWKATYRLVMPSAGDARRPMLQGWAIVDNTVGEDWDNVQLSLVAGAPQSFIQQISQPLYIQRPVVPLPERMLMTPQTHQAGLATAGAGTIGGTVTDSSGSALPGVSVTATQSGRAVANTTVDSAGRFRVTALAPGSYDLSFALSGFRTQTRTNVSVSGGMESVMNVALQLGGMSESMTVTAGAPAAPFAARAAGGVGGGRGGGGGTNRDAWNLEGGSPSSMSFDAFEAQAVGGDLGDLFEYKLKEPVTIRKNQSSLVPILGGDVTAEKVSIWNIGAGTNRPLRAVWLTNSTSLTLDGGSFTIVEGQAFSGEGLMDTLKAGEKRLLSYAMDLAMNVDTKAENAPVRVTKVTAARGVVVQQTQERLKQTYTARNDDAEARVLIIEHPVRAGWTLEGETKPVETTSAWHRFRITVAPKTTSTFTVEDVRPVTSQVSINTINDAQIGLLVRDQALTPQLEAALREVIMRKTDIARLSTELTAKQREIDEIGRDQDRVRGNMQALKGSSEERELLQRYVKQLGDQENRLEALRKEVATLQGQIAKAQAELGAFILTIAG